MSAPSSQIPELRRQAIDRLGSIQHELMISFLNRQIYQAVRDEIVARRPTADGTFLNSYSGLYARAQVMVVRRLADDHQDKPDSLWWLIERIKRNPAIASRANLVDHVRGERPDEEWLETYLTTEFSRLWGPNEHPETDRLVALQHSLVGELTKVLDFADTNVAHRDPRGPQFSVTYGEIHEALDRLAELTNSISVLFTSSSTAYDFVAIQGDWHECFRPALFPIALGAFEYPDPRGFV